MHEEALLRDLRRALEDVARRERVARITRVDLWIGALAHATEAGVRGRWPELVAGTAADGATLSIESSTDVRDPRATGLVLVRVETDGSAAGVSPERLLSPPARPAPGSGGR